MQRERGYTPEDPSVRLERLRSLLPDVSISELELPVDALRALQGADVLSYGDLANMPGIEVCNLLYEQYLTRYNADEARERANRDSQLIGEQLNVLDPVAPVLYKEFDEHRVALVALRHRVESGEIASNQVQIAQLPMQSKAKEMLAKAGIVRLDQLAELMQTNHYDEDLRRLTDDAGCDYRYGEYITGFYDYLLNPDFDPEEED